eukprot:TRINITY_DN11910_c0_g1_i1.p1 TRINITY_DN11910_c0_g1~~TRINITY_DN11910_c0_g1_i1.p1  ORF type:complete len:130 (+),score=22.68 TRINITY_DN11910_c0_g1_i1:96-485(+)
MVECTSEFKKTMMGLEKEIWVAMSESTAISKYTRHDASLSDISPRVAPYLSDGSQWLLSTYPVMTGKKEILDGCKKLKPLSGFKIDESSVEVRVLAGNVGYEQAAVISYKALESTAKGTTGVYFSLISF